MIFHKYHKCMVSDLCVFFHALGVLMNDEMIFHRYHKCGISDLCVRSFMLFEST